MFTKIRAFVSVAECGSFTEAARRLGLAQPAVSRYVRDLEQTAGEALIRRAPRAATLTVRGQQLLPIAKALIENADEFDRQLTRGVDRPSPRIVIGSEHYSNQVRIRNRIVDDFAQRHPETELVFVYAEPAKLREAVHKDEVDLAFISFWGEDEDLEGLPVVNFKAMVLAPKGLWTAGRLSDDDLRGQRIFLAEENVHPRFAAEAKRALAGFGVIWVHPSETEMMSRLRLVKSTGIPSLWLDSSVAEYDINDADLTVHELPCKIEGQLALVRKRQRPQSKTGIVGRDIFRPDIFWDVAERLVSETHPADEAPPL